jgi:hypothetical protein
MINSGMNEVKELKAFKRETLNIKLMSKLSSRESASVHPVYINRFVSAFLENAPLILFYKAAGSVVHTV